MNCNLVPLYFCGIQQGNGEVHLILSYTIQSWKILVLKNKKFTPIVLTQDKVQEETLVTTLKNKNVKGEKNLIYQRSK